MGVPLDSLLMEWPAQSPRYLTPSAWLAVSTGGRLLDFEVFQGGAAGNRCLEPFRL